MLTRKKIGIAGLVASLITMLSITLKSTTVDATYGGQIAQLLRWLRGVGAPDWFGYNQLEFMANIAMFMPFGFFLGLVLLPERPWLAGAIPVITTSLVETIQWLFLPNRFATFSDVLANSVGGVLGLGCAALLMRVLVAHQLRATHNAT